jgi:murein DD-endopeptidase MepM/ murein hydrolase activator NlpD
MKDELQLIKGFLQSQGKYFGGILKFLLSWTEWIKVELTKLMYRQKGRFSQSFVNVSMGVMSFVAIMLSGKVEEILSMKGSGGKGGSDYMIMATSGGMGANTEISNTQKGEITEYRVNDGDTVASIASKFNVTIDTILWENGIDSPEKVKVGQILRILPITGVRYKVKRGESIYTIAKKLGVDAQAIIDYPFNAFANDETFALNTGQDLMIPDGIKENEIMVDTQRYVAQKVAPIPGVVGEGRFIWPTNGMITQKYSWYHKAVDIANRSNPDITAAQGGTIVQAGWSGGGYGNFVVIDHGNGYSTLYAHMLNNSVAVKAGDRVRQGQKFGIMGSKGRSTGTHLLFEVRNNGNGIDPLSVLK